MSGSGTKNPGPMIGQSGVKYGLQIPAAKTVTEAPKRPKLGMFGDDDEELPKPGDKNAAIRAQQGTKRSDAKYNRMHTAALAEDANVYDYDSFHDGFQEARERSRLEAFAAERKGPRYIVSLMAAQQARKREQDIMYERRLARDRREEDEVHGDKDTFVTAAYKKKLEEDRLWAAEMEARDAADEKRSVAKRGNMDGFLNVMSAALNAGGSAADAVDTDNAGAGSAGAAGTQAPQTTGSAAPGAAPQTDKVKLRANKRIEEMDKYELARFRAEQRLQQGAAARRPPSGDGGGASDDAFAAAELQAGRGGGGADETSDRPADSGRGGAQARGGRDAQLASDGAGEAEGQAGGVKRRADAESISAAKARFLERKRARAGHG